MLITKNLIYQFSKNIGRKSYDLITIGPYANLVGRILSKKTKFPISILTVQQQNYVIRPQLLNMQQPIKVKLQQRNSDFADCEVGVKLKKIDAQRSQIQLENGGVYNYGMLVYSACDSQWKKQPQSLTNNSNILNDKQYTNLNDLYSLRSGTIVFTIPKQPHFGGQSYSMMKLKKKLDKQMSQILGAVQVVVLCEGDSLVSYNQELGQIFQKELLKSGVRVVKNVNFQINQATKTIKYTSSSSSKSTTQIPYKYIFQYLPKVAPTSLAVSSINPFKVQASTLKHETHQNMYIIGNIFNMPYNAFVISRMAETVAQSLSYELLKMRKRAAFKGGAWQGVWVAERKCKMVYICENRKISFNGRLYSIFQIFFGIFARLFGGFYIRNLINRSQYFDIMLRFLRLKRFQKIRVHSEKSQASVQNNKNQRL